MAPLPLKGGIFPVFNRIILMYEYESRFAGFEGKKVEVKEEYQAVQLRENSVILRG